MNKRPNFKDIKSIDEFYNYYWYRDELKQICKGLGLDYSGGKKELNHNIEEYFKGNYICKKSKPEKLKNIVTDITLETKLLECGFAFNQKFRDFFSKQTGIENFKFNTDMVATAKKVKETKDLNFTLKDMLDIFYGKKEYAKYDNSPCEWNKFLKDFCNDSSNSIFTNKIKVASILWNIVRESTGNKVYTKKIVQDNFDLIKMYIK